MGKFKINAKQNTSAKAKVLKNYPSARAKFITFSGDDNYGIFMGSASVAVAYGKTSFKAWLNAKNKIENGGF